MFSIGKNNRITFTKGDNADLNVRVFDKDGNEVQITAADTITFTLRKSAATQAAALTKTADLNTIRFVPTDTSNLAVGLYVYDIQYTNGEGEIQTIIPQSFFEIVEEITR